ncbi:chromate efflux transporter [Rubrivirga marina]|uniref:Chromate transporter n=1 Tax=Rubrivirga marina TaxID=1196024 RepID=A0A271IWW9_9BACT|nr:chromate efflux transporter [Rubrivirga marina]PAP75607.1 chromate transporter [Rubrivirga marina]
MIQETPGTPKDERASHGIPFGEAVRVWVRVALYSFGGPAGQIAVMHRLLVEEKRWVSEDRFLHAMNYCMLLPGPEAQQLATYVGWLLHRTKGGLVAGGLFILPGFVSILVLSVLYAAFQETTLVQALFYGLKPAVLAVVVEAVVRIGRRALKNGVMVGLAALAFVAIFFLDVPFPVIVLGAGLVGFLGSRFREDLFLVIRGAEAKEGDSDSFATDGLVEATRPPIAQTVRTAGVWLFVWLAPLAVMAAVLGTSNVFVQEGLFFSKAAVVTFGGAYAVLAYIAQQAVDTYGWLRPGEMLDGLGMAETTPGPLVQVVQFVGFMGAYRFASGLDPVVAGVIGSVVTTWVTFAPCFLWIFLGAPYIEYLRGRKALTSALSAITAAVVGVILNLAVWFALHTLFGEVDEVVWNGVRLFRPVWASVDPAAVVIAVLSAVALFRFKVGMIQTLGLSAAAGIVYYWTFLA